MAKYLDETGLSHFWDKIKDYVDGVISSVGAITGVKGDAETTYRTGNVNLTCANIGAAEDDHEHSAADITSGTLADARLPTKGSAGTAGTSSATSGATLAVPYVTTDAYGRVTGKGTHTHTINSLAASAVTGLGTIVDKDILTGVSCAASAYTAMGSISLAAGKWIITGCIQYPANTGMRYICISTNSGTTAPSAAESRTCAEYVYMSTSAICRLSTTRIVSISSATTYYLKAYQTNSGSSALSATGSLHAIRIA